MNRFEPATPENLSPSPTSRRIGLDPLWEMENKTEVSRTVHHGSTLSVLMVSNVDNFQKFQVSYCKILRQILPCKSSAKEMSGMVTPFDLVHKLKS